MNQHVFIQYHTLKLRAKAPENCLFDVFLFPQKLIRLPLPSNFQEYSLAVSFREFSKRDCWCRNLLLPRLVYIKYSFLPRFKRSAIGFMVFCGNHIHQQSHQSSETRFWVRKVQLQLPSSMDDVLSPYWRKGPGGRFFSRISRNHSWKKGNLWKTVVRFLCFFHEESASSKIQFKPLPFIGSIRLAYIYMDNIWIVGFLHGPHMLHGTGIFTYI